MTSLKVIKSTIGIVSSTTTNYDLNIKDLPDLPHEFNEVNQYLPFADLTLRYAIGKGNLASDESSDKAIQPLATTLGNKAKMLERAFGEVGKKVEQDNGNKPVLDYYRETLLQLGKPYRVEALMLSILKNLHELFTNQLVKAENFDKAAELKNAIEEISRVESSVPDSDFISSGTTITQNNASGATGYQYNGDGQRIITGNGDMHTYNAPVTYNVLSERDERNWRGEDPNRHASYHTDGNKDRDPETRDRPVGHGQLQHRQGQAHPLNSETVNESSAVRGTRPRGRQDFQIAIICALALEYDVVSLLFDQFWDEDESYGRARGDTNTYTTGRMGQYNVVLILLPNMGTIAAAGAAASFRSSYPSLQLAFLVGICGGVPWNGENEIHLGDVIISKSAVQYDLGARYHKAFVIRDTVDDSLGRPNKNIRSLVKSFETERIRDQLQQKACLYLKDVQKAASGSRRKYSYEYPGIANDKLFIATYRHKHRGPEPCKLCDAPTDEFCVRAAQASCTELGCDERQLVKRTDLEMRGSPGEPEIFIGRIASGNMVVKSGEHRDKIAHEQDVIALEMEGAGVWDEIPCIIVKGVCDYADSHKNDLWQRYAAATAASVMKAVLGRYIMTDR